MDLTILSFNSKSLLPPWHGIEKRKEDNVGQALLTPYLIPTPTPATNTCACPFQLTRRRPPTFSRLLHLYTRSSLLYPSSLLGSSSPSFFLAALLFLILHTRRPPLNAPLTSALPAHCTPPRCCGRRLQAHCFISVQIRSVHLICQATATLP